MSMEIPGIISKENKRKNSREERESNDGRKIKEGVYTIEAAANICKEQMSIKSSMVQKINDIEFSVKLFSDLYKLDFVSIGKEEITGHIMQRVLVGTTISEKTENGREFVFDDMDVNILKALQEIIKIIEKNMEGEYLSEVGKQEIKSMIDEKLEERGKLETVQ